MRAPSIISVVLSLTLSVHAIQYRPIVVWHGMGDNCCNPDSMGKIKETIQNTLPGVYVYSVQLAEAEGDDRRAGFFGSVNEQVEKVCQIIRDDENLRDGYNAIGFSQGGQFLRAVLQRCNWPRMHNLVTFGSQHAGVSDIPSCYSNDTTCQLMRSIVRRGAYTDWVQRTVVQAQYYKDVNKFELYIEKNLFLPDINNEHPFPAKNAEYARNLASLERFVLIRFTEDDMVKPRESSWFWYYDETGELMDVHDQPFYTEDWIGLRRLEESGRVVYQDCPGKHMKFNLEYLVDDVLIPYLSAPFLPSLKPQAPKIIEQSDADVNPVPLHSLILIDDEGDSPPVVPSVIAFWTDKSDKQRPHTRFEIVVDEDGDWMVSDGEANLIDLDRAILVDEMVGDEYSRSRTTVDSDGDWVVLQEPAVRKDECHHNNVEEFIIEEEELDLEEEDDEKEEEDLILEGGWEIISKKEVELAVKVQDEEGNQEKREEEEEEVEEEMYEVEGTKFGQSMFGGRPRMYRRRRF